MFVVADAWYRPDGRHARMPDQADFHLRMEARTVRFQRTLGFLVVLSFLAATAQLVYAQQVVAVDDESLMERVAAQDQRSKI